MAHTVAPGHDPRLTIPCLDRDFTAWRRGRTRALAWVVELDHPDLRELVDAGRHRLIDHLHPRYERLPHATLSFCGLLPAAVRQPDDFTKDDLAAHLEVLRGLTNGPIRLRSTGWGTFPMVPHLALECDWLHAAHDALTGAAPSGHEMDFLPHVTLGHYRGAWPLTLPLTLLAGLPFEGTWQSDSLSLVSYRAADIAGPLETIGRLDLTSGRWRQE